MKPSAYVRNSGRHASSQGRLDVARSNAVVLSETVAECGLHSSPRYSLVSRVVVKEEREV